MRDARPVLDIGHSAPITALAFSEHRLASGDYDGDVIVWNLSDLRMLHRFRCRQDVLTHLAFSPDGRFLAGGNCTLLVWDRHSLTTAAGSYHHGALRYEEEEYRELPGHSAGMLSVAYAPDGSRIATAGADAAVKVWDAASGALLSTFQLLPTDDNQPSEDWIAWRADGTYCASAGAARLIRDRP